MTPVARAWCLFLVVSFAGAGPVAAQGTRHRPELVQLAQRLTPSSSESGTRLAVVAIAEGPADYALRADPDLTREVRAAFADATNGRALVIVEPAEIDRAVRELRIGEPLRMGVALLVGEFVDADFVIVGEAVKAPNSNARVSVDLIDVERRRKVRTATAELAATSTTVAATTTPAAPPVAASAPTPAPRPAPTPATNGRSWIGRAGVATTVLAAFMTGMNERELRAARSNLLALGPNATAEWNRQFERAQDIQMERDRWRGVTIGAAAASAAYFFISSARAGASRSRGFAVPLPGSGKLTLEPFVEGMALVGRF